MPVVYKQLSSRYGFVSPGFAVDSSGNIDIAGDLTYNGDPVITNGLVSAGSGDLVASQIVTINASPTGSIDNIVIGGSTPRAGTFTTLTATTSVTLSPSGTVTISPSGALTISPTIAGSMNNVNIGATTRGTGSFTTLNVNTGLTLEPTSTGAINNVNIGASTPGTGKFTSSTITTAPTAVDHATRKDYVDTKIAAFSIALGS